LVVGWFFFSYPSSWKIAEFLQDHPCFTPGNTKKNNLGPVFVEKKTVESLDLHFVVPQWFFHRV